MKAIMYISKPPHFHEGARNALHRKMTNVSDVFVFVGAFNKGAEHFNIRGEPAIRVDKDISPDWNIFEFVEFAVFQF